MKWLTGWIFFTVLFVNLRAQDLEVTIHHISGKEGRLMVALFNSTDSFLKKGFRTELIGATPGTVVVKFKEVPAGEYAVSVVHDANENSKLDTNWLGIPTEGFGFSQDAMGTFGPPSFEKAKFRLDKDHPAIELTLRYFD